MAFRADPKLYVFGGTLCPEIGWYTYAEIDWYTFKEIVWYTLEEIRQSEERVPLRTLIPSSHYRHKVLVELEFARMPRLSRESQRSQKR